MTCFVWCLALGCLEAGTSACSMCIPGTYSHSTGPWCCLQSDCYISHSSTWSMVSAHDCMVNLWGKGLNIHRGNWSSAYFETLRCIDITGKWLQRSHSSMKTVSTNTYLVCSIDFLYSPKISNNCFLCSTTKCSNTSMSSTFRYCSFFNLVFSATMLQGLLSSVI